MNLNLIQFSRIEISFYLMTEKNYINIEDNFWVLFSNKVGEFNYSSTKTDAVGLHWQHRIFSTNIIRSSLKLIFRLAFSNHRLMQWESFTEIDRVHVLL